MSWKCKKCIFLKQFIFLKNGSIRNQGSTIFVSKVSSPVNINRRRRKRCQRGRSRCLQFYRGFMICERRQDFTFMICAPIKQVIERCITQHFTEESYWWGWNGASSRMKINSVNPFFLFLTCLQVDIVTILPT